MGDKSMGVNNSNNKEPKTSICIRLTKEAKIKLNKLKLYHMQNDDNDKLNNSDIVEDLIQDKYKRTFHK